MSIFLVLITAHFVSDFLLQSGFREARNGAAAIRHTVITGVVVAVSLEAFAHWKGTSLAPLGTGSVAALIALVHIGQDLVVSRFQERHGRDNSPLSFWFGDQGMHVLLAGIAAFALTGAGFAVPTATGNQGATFRIEAIFGAILLVALGTGVAAVLIAHLLEPFKQQAVVEGHDENLTNAGLWIGLCERVLLTLAIVSGSDVFSSIGLVMAAKSIYRFRELDRRANAEYYLLGSLASVCVAVVIGLGLRLLNLGVFNA